MVHVCVQLSRSRLHARAAPVTIPCSADHGKKHHLLLSQVSKGVFCISDFISIQKSRDAAS